MRLGKRGELGIFERVNASTYALFRVTGR